MISLIYNKIGEALSKYAILLIMALYLVIAVGSGLRGGVITGLVSLVLLYFAYRFGKQSYILLFYIFAYFYGFFKLMYSHDFYIFDMTFLLSNILVVHYLIQKKKIQKHYFYLYVILTVSILLNLHDNNELYYQTFSLFNYFLIFGILLYLNKEVSVQVANIILFFSSVVILINILQMFGFSINFSSTYQVSGINMFGVNFSRPSGVSGGIYKAGTKVLVALYLIYRYLPYSSFQKVFKKYKYFWYIIILFAIFSATLSQRSILLGIVILLPIIFIYKIRFYRKLKSYLLVLIAIAGLIALPFTVYYLDASNAMKFFMWVDVWNSFADANLINIIFGHGPFNVAYTLMGQDYGALAKIYSIEDWDIGEIGTPKLPHNVYIQALYDHGVLYLLTYLFLVYKAINIYFAKTNISNNILFYLIFILFINFALHNGIMNITLSLLFVYLKERKK